MGLSMGITLAYLIILQDVINVQAGKFPEINKCAGWNLSRIYCEKTMKAGKVSEINKRAGCNMAVQVGFFQRIIKTCCMFIR